MIDDYVPKDNLEANELRDLDIYIATKLYGFVKGSTENEAVPYYSLEFDFAWSAAQKFMRTYNEYSLVFLTDKSGMSYATFYNYMQLCAERLNISRMSFYGNPSVAICKAIKAMYEKGLITA